MTAVPPAQSFAWTTVLALRELGGSGSVEEINERVVALRGLTEAQQAVPHSPGSRTEVEYRLAWARTLAKNLGLVENSSRGIWVLTEAGRRVEQQEVERLKRERSKRVAAERATKAKKAIAAGTANEPDEDLDEAIEQESQDWKSALLEILKEIEPSAFERLSKRLLREAGFVNVRVTGGSGDGGIDGQGVYRLSLVSFPVYFQCKRYKGTVGSGQVRDFRGAMQGRGDRGLLITTGTFTADAKAEATRDGAPPIDLIDGDALTDLLRQYGLGVESLERTVYDVTIRHDFFAAL